MLDPERDADVIGRIEAQPSMTGYVRELVRRDVHDERLDFAALKASELQAENAKLRELARWAARILTGIFPYVDYSRCTALEAVAAWKVEASKLGIEVVE